MDKYAALCEQLYQAACGQGLRKQTQVVAPGDGGQGLREEMACHFFKFQYILDHRHLESHFYETAEALAIDVDLRKGWVKKYIDQLWENRVTEVLGQLAALYQSNQHERLRRLMEYLERFKDTVNYKAA